jgi:hypothetical protein
MKTIRYHPLKILHNKHHTIGTITFSTHEQAYEYALSRGLNDKEIYIKELIYYDNSWDTDINFNKIEGIEE